VLTFGAMGEHASVDDLGLVLLGERVRREALAFDQPVNLQNACTAFLLASAALHRMAADGHGPAQRLVEGARERWRRKHPPRTYGQATPEPHLYFIPELIGPLSEFRGLAHRMEELGCRDGVRVINNSMCTNPDAVIKSATAVREPTHLLIGGINKDLDFRPLRTYLSASKDRAYLYGRDAASLDAALGGRWPRFGTLAEAFRAATEAAQSGEAIMLAPGCASTDQFRDFVDRGDVFRALAKEWLER
jgi:UDP-N-acetylmuramoylalanine--D-glutamate ligase